MAPRAHSFPTLRWSAAIAALSLAAAAPAFAQQTVEEVTVTGHFGPAGAAQSLSQTVSYRDLDLTTEAGRSVLAARIKDTAHSLCLRLGEDPTLSVPPVPSCEQSAINSAAEQQRMAIAQARPRSIPSQPAPSVSAEATPPPVAPSVGSAAQPASTIVTVITNGPVPDTPENRAKYGGPMSRAGKRTAPIGN